MTCSFWLGLCELCEGNQTSQSKVVTWRSTSVRAGASAGTPFRDANLLSCRAFFASVFAACKFSTVAHAWEHLKGIESLGLVAYWADWPDSVTALAEQGTLQGVPLLTPCH